MDVPTALTTRSYGAAGKLVIEVVDKFCPWAGGRFAIGREVRTGATCKPTRQEPDIVMGAAELATGYLGGGNFRSMARAGRVEERSDGALKRTDAMFAAERAPWCPFEF